MTKEESTDGPKQAGRARRVKRDDVRRRLLEAAYGVFAERGFEGASLERVAEAAGFSKGAVYSNFSSKDELFFELIAARIDERLGLVQAGIERSAPRPRSGADGAAQAARSAGKALRELGQADPEWQQLFLEFWLRCARNEELREKLALRRREMRGRIADLVEAKARAEGATISRGEAMDLATTTLAMSNGFGIEGIIDPKAAPPRLFGEILTRIIGGARFE